MDTNRQPAPSDDVAETLLKAIGELIAAQDTISLVTGGPEATRWDLGTVTPRLEKVAELLAGVAYESSRLDVTRQRVTEVLADVVAGGSVGAAGKKDEPSAAAVDRPSQTGPDVMPHLSGPDLSHASHDPAFQGMKGP